MDSTRKYRDIESLVKLHEDYGHYGSVVGINRAKLPIPRLTKNFKEFKYYESKGDGFNWRRESQKGRRHFNVLDGSDTHGKNIYGGGSKDGSTIKKDESGRPYVVIKYDPNRTYDKRMPIEKKGDKWFLEDELGFKSSDTVLFSPSFHSLGEQRKRDVVVNDGKGLEVKKIMGKRPRDFRTYEKKVKVGRKTKILPPEDVGEWKRTLFDEYTGRQSYQKAGRPSANDNVNKHTDPVVAQLEIYLPKVEVATESSEGALDDYWGKRIDLKRFELAQRVSGKLKGIISRRIARQSDAKREVNKANRFLSETTEKPIGGKFMAKAEQSFMGRELTKEEGIKAGHYLPMTPDGPSSMSKIYETRVLTPREAKEYIMSRGTRSLKTDGGYSEGVPARGVDRWGRNTNIYKLKMGQTGFFTDEELKDWDKHHTKWKRRRFRELTTKRQLIARSILMKDLYKPVSRLNATNRNRQRRKPLRANVRRDNNKAEAFSQNVKERDAERKTAKVDTEEGVRFVQRSGTLTATDLMKTAPPTYHQRGIRDRRTAGGQILRGDREGRRRLLTDSRYISATEQAIIDRRIRNTEAERKLDDKIKDVRKEEKDKQDTLSILNQTKQKVIEDLQKKNTSQLHSHEVITRGNMSATILGSDAVELNKIIARGGGYMTLLGDMVRKGELTSRAVIGQLDFSAQPKPTQKKERLLNLLNEGSEFRPNQRYFFKEMDDKGKRQTFSGIFVKGGERGSNVVMVMDDGARRVIRKKQIILPEEAVGARPQPKLPPPPQGGLGEEAEGFLGGGFLQQHDARKSSSSSSISSVSEEEDPIVERYNELIPKAENDERLLRVYSDNLTNIEERRPKTGIFGRVNKKELEVFEEEKLRLESSVETLTRELDSVRSEANSIASQKGFDLPFYIPDEGGGIGIDLDEESPRNEGVEPQLLTAQTQEEFELLLDAPRETTEEEEEAEAEGLYLSPLEDDPVEAVAVAEASPIVAVEQQQPQQTIEDEREAFGFTKKELKGKRPDIVRLASTDRVFLWSTKHPSEFKVGGRRVEGKFLTKSQYESFIDDAEIGAKSKVNLLAKYDKALASNAKEVAINNQQVLFSMGLAPRPVDARTTMGQID